MRARWRRRAALLLTSSSWTWKTRLRRRKKKTPAPGAVDAVPGFAPRETVIRSTRAGTPWHVDDLDAAAHRWPVPSCCPSSRMPGRNSGGTAQRQVDTPLWAMIETPRALFHALAIADAGVECLLLGSNDLLHAMEGRHRADRANLQAAMSLSASWRRGPRASRCWTACTTILTRRRISRAACTMARDFGFDGKSVIHPLQIATANGSSRPRADEIALCPARSGGLSPPSPARA